MQHAKSGHPTRSSSSASATLPEQQRGGSRTAAPPHCISPVVGAGTHIIDDPPPSTVVNRAQQPPTRQTDNKVFHYLLIPMADATSSKQDSTVIWSGWAATKAGLVIKTWRRCAQPNPAPTPVCNLSCPHDAPSSVPRGPPRNQTLTLNKITEISFDLRPLRLRAAGGCKLYMHKEHREVHTAALGRACRWEGILPLNLRSEQ